VSGKKAVAAAPHELGDAPERDGPEALEASSPAAACASRQAPAPVKPRLDLLLLGELLRQHVLSHLSGRQGGGFVLQGLGTTYQRMLEIL
jgi:hypothetical protein